MHRTKFVLLAIAGLALASSAAYAEAPFPSHSITLEVGSNAGGSNDLFARAIAKRLSDALGQSVIVENKPAGGGIIANQSTARAKPDGYTLVVVSSTFTTSAAIRSDLPYDVVKDFTPVALLAKGPLLVTVGNDTPYKSMADLVAAAKASPGKINYGSSGLGSINQFATEVFAADAGIKLTHVPYKGMAPATNDLLGGQIQVLVASSPSIGAMVKADKVRALAVTTGKRSPVAPNLPSMDEVGLHKSDVSLWWGILAPAKTPQPIVDALNAAIDKELASDEMKAFLLQEGAEAAPGKPADFATLISNELQRWKAIAKTADIKPE